MHPSVHSMEIIYVGKFVADYLQEGKLILFSDPVPPDLADYCAVHRAGDFNDVLLPGQLMKINEVTYLITATGSVAAKNLKQLGHITLNFDGAISAELPGMVHLSGPTPQEIHPGDRILIFCE